MKGMAAFRKRLGTVVSLVLVLCLPSGGMRQPGTVGLKVPGVPRQTVFFAPPADAGAGSILSAGRRAHFPSCDSPFQNALIFGGIPFGWTGGSLPFGAGNET